MHSLERFFHRLTVFALFICTAQAIAVDRGQSTVRKTTYHGWPDCYVLSNGKVEAVCVPAVGRVMQFRFAGEEDGPFWENRSLDGHAPDPKSSEWGNFGGDKTWPSPQADWGKIANRAWPPPPAFDSMPVKVSTYSTAHGEALLLISPVDPYFGIVTERRIELAPGKSEMRISTTYNKVEGSPRKIGVWIITQLKDPVAVFAPIPRPSLYAEGFDKQSDFLPLGLKAGPKLLFCKRDPKNPTKIGTDAGSLLWIGRRHIVHIESSRVPGGEYPDHGSSAEIYTNPDPNTYVELELLGPLRTMKQGDVMARTSTYTLLRRGRPDPQSEAKALLKH